jgi:hypothetical protein
MAQILTFPLGGAQREGRISTHDDAVRYLFAGRAAFTLVSTRTDRRLPFAIRAMASAPARFAVLVRGELAGMVDFDGKAFAPSLWPSSDRAALAISWFLKKLMVEGALPPEVELWHDGRCARCRSLLTTPWANARGLDADCAAHLAGEKAG